MSECSSRLHYANMLTAVSTKRCDEKRLVQPEHRLPCMMSEVPTCYKLERGEGHHIMHTMLPRRLRKVTTRLPDLPAEAQTQRLLPNTALSRQQVLTVDAKR